jgi:hypothetical protein
MKAKEYRKTEIIEGGDIRKMSILYLTHFAFSETELDLPPLVRQTDQGPKYIGPDLLLTTNEVDELFEKIQLHPKGAMYKEMRRVYGIFTHFKDRVELCYWRSYARGLYMLNILSGTIDTQKRAVEFTGLRNSSDNLITDFVNGEKQVYYYHPKDIFITSSINDINCLTGEIKCTLHNLKLLTKKHVPLDPFKEWVNIQKKTTEKTLDQLITTAEKFSLYVDQPYKIKPFEAVEYEPKDEDLDDILNTEL